MHTLVDCRYSDAGRRHEPPESGTDELGGEGGGRPGTPDPALGKDPTPTTNPGVSRRPWLSETQW